MRRIVFIWFVMVLFGVQSYALDIIFRYDDFRLQEDSLQDEMIEMFAEENIPLHIAIIPYNQDTTPILQNCQSFEHVKELQRHGILKIALHGFCHKGETFQGEFLSLNEQEQRFRLEMEVSYWIPSLESMYIFLYRHGTGITKLPWIYYPI